ncbi:hypothetical protein [Rhizorhabdus sp.]|uniref:hypothetical protein n=1 Tax=Rhizorhabdus sp. TaxID=1968843 RepID=UPI0035AEB93A
MAVQFKYTLHRGDTAPKMTVAAGTTIAGSDAIEINIDQTKMTKGEAIILMENFTRRLQEAEWPPL